MALSILLSAFAALAVAAPQATTTAPAASEASYPAYTTAPNFRLVANVIGDECEFDTSIQNWEVTSYHTGAGLSVAYLDDPAKGPGRAFYINGTASQIRDGTGDLLSDGGLPAYPDGLIVSAANVTDSEGRRMISLDIGSGSAGVGIAGSPSPVPYLTYNNAAEDDSFGGWYACNATYPFDSYGPLVALYYRSLSETTPFGCTDLILYPQW